MKGSWILDMDRENPVPVAGGTDRHLRPIWALVPVALLLVALLALGGCSEDDCVSCVELELPPAPSGVYSLSGDHEITVYWNDIYTENPDWVTAYRIYVREWFPDVEDDFVLIGEIAWDENFDEGTGQHWFVDDFTGVEGQINGTDWEYAVSAVNAAGREGPLSLEIVIDTPLPISDSPVQVHDGNGPTSELSGFDFSLAADGDQDPGNPADGVVDPDVAVDTADIRVYYEAGVPYVETLRAGVEIQDYGIFLTGADLATLQIQFQAASWAPENGYSSTGVLELIDGHVYILRIAEPGVGDIHYAKFGVTQIGTSSVWFLWAYQLVPTLRELKVPDRSGDDVRVVSEFAPIKL
jgi:hypothetical protein